MPKEVGLPGFAIFCDCLGLGPYYLAPFGEHFFFRNIFSTVLEGKS